jgi:hypothetical protein
VFKSLFHLPVASLFMLLSGNKQPDTESQHPAASGQSLKTPNPID